MFSKWWIEIKRIRRGEALLSSLERQSRKKNKTHYSFANSLLSLPPNNFTSEIISRWNTIWKRKRQQKKVEKLIRVGKSSVKLKLIFYSFRCQHCLLTAGKTGCEMTRVWVKLIVLEWKLSDFLSHQCYAAWQIESLFIFFSRAVPWTQDGWQAWQSLSKLSFFLRNISRSIKSFFLFCIESKAFQVLCLHKTVILMRKSRNGKTFTS